MYAISASVIFVALAQAVLAAPIPAQTRALALAMPSLAPRALVTPLPKRYSYTGDENEVEPNHNRWQQSDDDESEDPKDILASHVPSYADEQPHYSDHSDDYDWDNESDGERNSPSSKDSSSSVAPSDEAKGSDYHDHTHDNETQHGGLPKSSRDAIDDIPSVSDAMTAAQTLATHAAEMQPTPLVINAHTAGPSRTLEVVNPTGALA